MRFDYYRRLSRAQRAIYRRSDEYDRVELDDPTALVPLADTIGAALAADDRVEVDRRSQGLVRALCDQLCIPSPEVRVLAQRPSSAREELHGLYYPETHRQPRILVWMRTARRGQPIAHRTFLRTLLHEVCHHLDFALLDLEESFHTEGFFQRESSLLRQLLPRARRSRQLARQSAPTEPSVPAQLALFD